MKYIHSLRLKQDNRVARREFMGLMPILHNLQELKHVFFDNFPQISPIKVTLVNQPYNIIKANDSQFMIRDLSNKETIMNWNKLQPEQYYSMVVNQLPHNAKNDARGVLFQAVYGLPQLAQVKKAFEDNYHVAFENFHFQNPPPPPRNQ